MVRHHFAFPPWVVGEIEVMKYNERAAWCKLHCPLLSSSPPLSTPQVPHTASSDQILASLVHLVISTFPTQIQSFFPPPSLLLKPTPGPWST